MNLSKLTSRIFIWAKSNYVLLVGAVIALTLSAITFHSDLTNISIVAQRIAQGNFDIYTRYKISGDPYGMPIMPPLIFLFDGFLFWVLKLFRVLDFTFAINSIPMWQAFLLKLRYFIVFVASYFLVYQVGLEYTKDKVKARVISALWITSPILLYLTFTQGNNDIYPAFFALFFLLFAFKKKYFWAMVFLGLAAAMKNYGVFLFLPMAIILAEKDIKKTIYYLAAAGTAFILPSLFYLKHLLNFSQAGGEGLLMLESVITSRISFMIFPLAYFAIVLYLYFADNGEKLRIEKAKTLVLYGFLVMSLFFTLEFYIPQWFLWILPFFVLTIYNNKRLFWLYTIATGGFLLSIITIWVSNIDANLFRPIMNLAPSGHIFALSPNALRASMVYSGLSAVMLVFIYFMIRDYQKSTDENLPKTYVFWNLAPLIAYLAIMCIFIYLTINNIHIHLGA